LRILTEEIAETQHWQLNCILAFKKDWVYFEARYVSVAIANRNEQIESNFCSCFFAWSI